jgi:hypothetical protein
MQNSPPGPGQMKVQIDLAGVEGTYSNLVLLAHSASEFILDFARLMPGVPKAKVYARIIMTPQNAKALHRVLEDKIEGYEKAFGKIRSEDPSATKGDIGFKTP